MTDTSHLALVHDNQMPRRGRHPRKAELPRAEGDEQLSRGTGSSPSPAIALVNDPAPPQQGGAEFQALVRRVQAGENPRRLLAGLKARRVEMEQALQEVQSNIQVLAIAIVLKDRGLL